MIDWAELTSLAEFLAAVGALAALIYLARQIRQSNQIALSTAASSVLDKYNSFHNLILSNPHTAELSARLSDPDFSAESLADEEQTQSFVNLFFNIYISIQVAYDQQQIDERLFTVYQDDFSAALNRWPGAVPYFQKLIERYPDTKSYQIFSALGQRNSGKLD